MIFILYFSIIQHPKTIIFYTKFSLFLSIYYIFAAFMEKYNKKQQ